MFQKISKLRKNKFVRILFLTIIIFILAIYFFKKTNKESDQVINKKIETIDDKKVKENRPLKLILKADKLIFPLIHKKTVVPLKIEGQKSYKQIVLFITSEMRIINKMPIKSASFIYTFTEPGKYTLKLYDRDEHDNETEISNELNIEINYHRPLPSPKVKRDHFEIEVDQVTSENVFKYLFKAVSFFSEFIISSSYAETTNSTLAWENVEGAFQFRIEIFKDKKMSQKVADFKTKSNHYNWKPKEAGNYFWRVRGLDIYGIEGKASNLAQIIFLPHFSNLSPPMIQSAQINQTNILEVTLMPIKRAQSYEGTIRFIDNNNKVIREESFSTSTIFFSRILNGLEKSPKYEITVRGVSKKNQFTRYSEPFQFNSIYKTDSNEVESSEVIQSSEWQKGGKILSLVYQRADMGNEWNNSMKDLNGTSGKSNMNFLSLRYFLRNGIFYGIGFDYFYLANGSVKINGLAISSQITYPFYFTSKKNLSINPLFGLFSSPNISNGVYGSRFEVPLQYKIYSNLNLSAGLGYLLGKLHGVEKIESEADLNVRFKGLSGILELTYLY
jgi:hypothetical protein